MHKTLRLAPPRAKEMYRSRHEDGGIQFPLTLMVSTFGSFEFIFILHPQMNPCHIFLYVLCGFFERIQLVTKIFQYLIYVIHLKGPIRCV
jgi:hypothetical protein